jgi:hypothetical protein
LRIRLEERQRGLFPVGQRRQVDGHVGISGDIAQVLSELVEARNSVWVVLMACRPCGKEPTGAGAGVSGASDGADDIGHGVASFWYAELVAQLESAGANRHEPTVWATLRGARDPVLELVVRQGAGWPASATAGHRQVVHEGAGVRGKAQALRPRAVVVKRARAGAGGDDQSGKSDVLGALVGDDGQDAGR